MNKKVNHLPIPPQKTSFFMWSPEQLEKLVGIKTPNPMLIIEGDATEVFEAHAKLMEKRFKEDAAEHFPGGFEIGIIGQYMFHSFLTQKRIPYIYSEPVFRLLEVHWVTYDFIVPGFGSIEVKTSPSNSRCTLVNQNIWREEIQKEGEPADYVVGLQMLAGKPKGHYWAEIKGYIKGNEVERYDNKPDVCKKSPCHAIPFERLRNFSEIQDKLAALSIVKDIKQLD